MADTTTSLQQYLDKEKPFIMPNYQRGYIWGKSRGAEKDSVAYMIESILNAHENKSELFLQGVTVSENQNIELIDGQQRTTFLYLLLSYLQYDKPFSILYPIREQSQKFLNDLKGKTTEEIVALSAENDKEEFQDIYYFKKTLRDIDAKLKTIEKKELLTFLLTNIKFLYINISQEKATMVFSMMNGNKAKMKVEEIIKAEMLRLVSLGDAETQKQEEQEAIRWEQNALRSRYAREWDKWIYWWNREDVQKFYHTNNVMGLLVETYFYAKNDKKFNFENFRDKLLRGENNTLQAKNTFYELRHLQKKFEDVFNSISDEPKLHNKIGAILILLGKEERKAFIRDYFAEKRDISIDDYLKFAYLGLTHTQIMNVLNNKEDAKNEVENKKAELLQIISNDNLYNDNESKIANKQLLRRNIEEDSKLGRAFDFSIWHENSLEHICPKSKFEQLDELDEISKLGHGIGNLVLLYKNENSSFGAKDFEEKKSLYFDLTRDKTFRSRHLLHSISVFAKSKWGVEEIQANKESVINEIKTYYAI